MYTRIFGRSDLVGANRPSAENTERWSALPSTRFRGSAPPPASWGQAASSLLNRCGFSASGFSLLEVVVSVGVFAIGIVTAIGLFAGLAKSAGEITDTVTAANLGYLLRVQLHTRASGTASFESQALLLKAGGNLSVDPRTDSQLIFASRDGSKAGGYHDPIWGGSDTEKFFEIALVRNDALPPVPSADTNLFTYIASIRWPAFVPDVSNNSVKAALPANRDQQQSLFLPGAIMR